MNYKKPVELPLKVFIIIPFILLPFCSVSQTPDFYEMFCESIRLNFFTYSSKEKLNRFDSVFIYGYKQSHQITDSTLISKIFIGKSIDTTKIIKNKRGFVLEYGQRYVFGLYSDKNFNSRGQLECNNLYINDDDLYFKIKYVYKKYDTLSITTYAGETDKILEQSFFEYKKGFSEKTIYDYTDRNIPNIIKKDKLNRIIYTEYCNYNYPYYIKTYYNYSDSALTIKTENPIYCVAKFTTDIYKYNSSGLIESKTNKIITKDSLIYPSEYYDLIKFYYK